MTAMFGLPFDLPAETTCVVARQGAVAPAASAKNEGWLGR